MKKPLGPPPAPPLVMHACRFSPDKRWHVDHMLQVMAQAGQHVKEDACRTLIVLITNTPELQVTTKV